MGTLSGATSEELGSDGVAAEQLRRYETNEERPEKMSDFLPLNLKPQFSNVSVDSPV